MGFEVSAASSGPSGCGCCLSFVTFVLMLVAIPTYWWSSREDNGVGEIGNAGLWKVCANSIGCTDVSDINDVDLNTSKLRNTQAWTIIGVIVNGAVIVMASLAINSSMRCGMCACSLCGAIWSWIAFLCYIIGLASYASYRTDVLNDQNRRDDFPPLQGNGFVYDYSYYLVVSSAVMIGVAALALTAGCCAAPKDSGEGKKAEPDEAKPVDEPPKGDEEAPPAKSPEGAPEATEPPPAEAAE